MNAPAPTPMSGFHARVLAGCKKHGLTVKWTVLTADAAIVTVSRAFGPARSLTLFAIQERWCENATGSVMCVSDVVYRLRKLLEQRDPRREA